MKTLTYAWMYGAQARKDGKERAVPKFWDEYTEAWLQGFDDGPITGGRTQPVSDHQPRQPSS